MPIVAQAFGLQPAGVDARLDALCWVQTQRSGRLPPSCNSTIKA